MTTAARARARKAAVKRIVAEDKPPRRRKVTLEKLDPSIRKAIAEECEKAAKRATKAAVRETLLLMGIDAKTPEGLLATQKNNAFLNRVREAAESRPARYGVIMFSSLLTTIGGIIVYVVTHFGLPSGGR